LAKLQPWDKRKYPGRKPRALGRAVTKLELVDPDPTLDAEEEKIVAQWNAQYDVDMTHCYDLMKEKAVMDSLDTGVAKRAINEERVHHVKMMKENDEWNAAVGAIREADMARLCVEEEEEIRSTVVSELQEREVRRLEVQSFVDLVQVESENFITLENIEEKVAEAFETPIIDYNFSIDRNGNKLTMARDSALLS